MGIALCVVALPAQAQTTNISAIVERMEAIIAEMQALQSEFQSLSGQLSADVPSSSEGSQPSGAVLGAATNVLQEEAVYGNTNATIEKIQTLLATDPLIYPDGITSGFFGPKTREAIRNLQSRFGMDPVGVVGPSTSELIMEYFVAYPGGQYPDDVLQSRPTARVAGAQTSTGTDDTPATTPTPSNTATPIDEIYLHRDSGETVIRVVFKDGDATGLAITSTDEDDIVEAIADKTGVSEAQVRVALDMSELKPARGDDYDEDDADEMIEDAEAAIDDAEEAIEDAEDDGKDVDEAEELLDEAKEELEDAEDAFDDEDYDEAYEHAEEAEELAEEAEDEAEDSEYDEDEVEEMIEDAEDAIDDAEEAIEEAEDNGDDVDEAEELLEEAEDALDDAEEAFDDGDYEDAYEYAEEAIELAEEAEDEL